jgi:metal-responsive CopG/Arc/MetJ family transcriptional regulator
MSTARNDISLPDDLVDLIKETARAQGRNPGEIVRDAVERYISDDRWQRVLAYGKRQAQRLGYTEDEVERLIHECRPERDLAP